MNENYIASGLSVGIDTIGRRVLIQWSDDTNGPLVISSLTAEQVGKLEDALASSLRLLQNTPPIEVAR